MKRLSRILSCIFLVCILIFAVAPISSASPDSDTSFVSADYALKLLHEGNLRFMQGNTAPPVTTISRRMELANGQHPFAIIVTCSDSRVSPEIIFNQGLGDLFVIRVAGNVVGPVELGSIEYAAQHLHTRLIVVLGHEKCGAVKATVDGGGDLPFHLKSIAQYIKPSLVDVNALPDKAPDIYEAVTDTHIASMVRLVRYDLDPFHLSGLQIVGAKYHLESGEVSFSDIK